MLIPRLEESFSFVAVRLGRPFLPKKYKDYLLLLFILLIKCRQSNINFKRKLSDTFYENTLPFPLPGLYCPPLASFPLRLGWRFLNPCPLKLSLAEGDDAEDDEADWELVPSDSPVFVRILPLARSEVKIGWCTLEEEEE